MTQKFAKVLAPSFIGGGVKQAGTILPGYDGPYGEYLKECDKDGNLLGEDSEKAAPAKAGKPVADKTPSKAPTKPVATDPAHKVQHNGGGNWIVLDAEGKQVGEVFKKDADDKDKAKVDAQAEADRLNGVDPAPPADPTLPDA